ncbi:DEAD/DEAH box helicase family protein [Streptomyces sp. DSM 41982]|uniref:DEAD/DEAH box helicase family protein n=1 Tax=Streptomyces evansiae TaxID=3075535 RepID=A0ABD5E6D9_9ACTN|nr:MULTISPECIES: DEAD/DEAH box helicase family protein [unclassified Streptomyces]MDT0416991.1 DEAD/DEAH box helicase family protein [Streptomyces sp. DSM 41982]SCE32430.1 type I restriction enzyme, R subunit [Streptomyces sp. SolWspMP-sol7th]
MNDARVYTEKAFENAVEAALLRSGWQRGLSNTYNPTLGIDTSELSAFLGASQNDAWLALQDAYGEDEEQAIGRFAKRVAREIDSRGLLDVLRRGVNDRNVKIRLAYFRPAHTLAADALVEYDANRLTFVRQFHYSDVRPADSLDMAFFLNGLPVASVELKNGLTGQTVEDAKRQYRRDRDPKELFFAKRSLVHFAVDPTLAFLTTRLAGDATRFLPFNTGSGGPGQIGGAGNVPASTDGKYPTSYLFDEVWARDNWLELLQRFLHVEDAAAKAGRAPSHKPGSAHTQPLIFPRFHQWDAVRKLIAHAARHGAGENYLIQHSAGSGKSNTIAWLAHHLSSLHTSHDPGQIAPTALASGLGANKLVFDKVIVITDRRVLDKQLQDTIYQFDHKAGVVVRIDESSQQLADALTGPTARIVITTVQKFPFVLDKVAGLGSQRYAVIIDEAHSSQGGESAAALKKALGRLGSDAVDKDGDPLTAAALARGKQPNLSFFAFTATPKAKTIDLFGTPYANPGSGNQEKGPFHVYSMRQAIEESFILDVLGNYITYATYFKLQEAAAEEAEQQVDPRKARSRLVRAALMSEASMASRAKIIVDHFRSHSSPRLGGRAKAMVVTSGRDHAVRLYQAMRAYIDQRGFTDCGTLVAFSGALTLDGIEYTEAKLNGFAERELPARFGYTRADDPNPPSVPKPEHRILVVAEKYQTGFDQPLLTTMYVDKILANLAAVQTLSRLNRTHRLKTTEDLFILDFANRPEDIEQAFQRYYEASVSEPTDPNLLFDREREVMAYQLLVEAEMDAFVTAYFAAFQGGSATDTAIMKAHARLYGYLQPALDRFNALNATEPDTAAEFRRALDSYTKAYGWLSHVIGFENLELERLYQYGRFLLRRLPAPVRSAGADIGMAAPSHMRIAQTGTPELHLEAAGAQVLAGLVPEAAGTVADAEEMSLAEVIQSVNDEYGTGLSTADQILLGQLVVAVSEDPDLRAIALHQDQEVFGGELEKDLDRIVIDQAASNDALMVRYFDDTDVNRLFKQVATQQAYQLIRRPVRREAERRATEQRAAEIKSSGTRPAQPPTT